MWPNVIRVGGDDGGSGYLTGAQKRYVSSFDQINIPDVFAGDLSTRELMQRHHECINMHIC